MPRTDPYGWLHRDRSLGQEFSWVRSSSLAPKSGASLPPTNALARRWHYQQVPIAAAIVDAVPLHLFLHGTTLHAEIREENVELLRHFPHEVHLFHHPWSYSCSTLVIRSSTAMYSHMNQIWVVPYWGGGLQTPSNQPQSRREKKRRVKNEC